MIWFPVKRATLLIPNEPHPHHLNILLTDGYKWGESKHTLVVSISTLRKNSDKTCLLYKGDHEFIKHNSFVRYKSCKIIEVKKLEEGIKRNIFIGKHSIKEDIFARIVKGLLESPQTPPEAYEFYKVANNITD